MSERLKDEKRPFELDGTVLRRELFPPNLPPGLSMQDLIDELNLDRESIESSSVRKLTAELLYDFGTQILTFGGAISPDEVIDSYTHTPVVSESLVKKDAIHDKNIKREIEIRSEEREKRKRAPAENRVEFAIITPEEIKSLPEPIRSELAGREHAILLREYYTVLSTNVFPVGERRISNVEANVAGSYIVGQKKDGHYEVFFLGETLERPHAHVSFEIVLPTGESKVVHIRPDTSTNPEFIEVAASAEFRPLQETREDFKATNEQLTVLLALLEYQPQEEEISLETENY